MKRQVSLEEISDGRLYSRNDMVRADCGGCKGCCECCSGMGTSVILDPFDVYRLTAGLSCTFEELLADKIELNVVDGIILPNLKMKSISNAEKSMSDRNRTGTERAEACAFLNEEGRCSIHAWRPGICRLFPLGRYYEKEKRSFRYFLQIHECQMPAKTKVKVEKWLDTPQLSRYETYINNWHYLLEDIQQKLADGMSDDDIKNANVFILKLFYFKPYNKAEDFYPQFESRLKLAQETLF